MSIADALSSRYLLFRALRDAHVPAGNACLVVDLIHGPESDDAPESWDDDGRWELGPEPEPYEAYQPSEDDLEDYRRWADRLDAMGRDWPAEYPASVVTDEDVARVNCAG